MLTDTDAGARIADAARRFVHLFSHSDPASIAACYTEDARMFAANMSPVCGRAAIESAFKFTKGPGHRLELRTEELDIQGTTAIELGAYVRRENDGSLVDSGRYMVIWKRVGDQWKIHRDMFTTGRKAAGAPAQPFLPPDQEPKPPFIQYPMPPK